MYNASFCIGSAEASNSEVLAPVERQMCSHWAQQAHDATDTYAEEIPQRFRSALATRLESTEELFLAEVAVAPLRWRRILEFSDHSKTRIRATAQVVLADVVDSHRAQQVLIELLSLGARQAVGSDCLPRVLTHTKRAPWTRKLTWNCRVPPVRRRMRAERALICLEEHFGSQLVDGASSTRRGAVRRAEEDRNGERSRAGNCGTRG